MIRLVTPDAPFIINNDTESLLEFQLTLTSMENKEPIPVKIEFTEGEILMVLIDELVISPGDAFYFTQPYGVLSPEEGMIISLNKEDSSPLGVWFEAWEKR